MNQKQAKANEPFFVVDEHDRPLEPLPRRLVHGHGVWHRVAHVWVVNDNRQVLCQQRSLDKELNPGFWEGCFGGHSHPGESYEATARREMAEELGIDPQKLKLKLWKVYKYSDASGKNREFQAIFVARWNGSAEKLHFKDQEVAAVARRTTPDLRVILSGDQEKHWTRCGYELDLLHDLMKERA